MDLPRGMGKRRGQSCPRPWTEYPRVLLPESVRPGSQLTLLSANDLDSGAADLLRGFLPRGFRTRT